MKTNWFVESHGGMQPLTNMPRILVASARNINSKALSNAEKVFEAAGKRAADLHYFYLKPFEERYEREKSFSRAILTPSPCLLHYSNEMRIKEDELNTIYLQAMGRARKMYQHSILHITGHLSRTNDFYRGILSKHPRSILHPVHCRCGVLPYDRR